VVVNYNKSSEAADQVVKQIQEAGGKAAAFQADVSDFKQAEGLVKFAIETFGDLSILVNNAGITKDTLIMMMSEADWDSVINTNLKSTFNCSKAAVRHMMRKRYGRIVNMASVAGLNGTGGGAAYVAAKHGVVGLTRQMAVAYSASGITINAVCPGPVLTDLRRHSQAILGPGTPDMADRGVAVSDAQVRAMVPAGRRGTVEDIAAAVCYLASDEAAYVTGHTLVVDGGWRAR
jgi:3-oxoacyl-[acyl-carrier protein] reductase